MDFDEDVEEGLVDLFYDWDRDLMHRILNDATYPDLVAALADVVTTKYEEEDPDEDEDDGIDIGIAMGRLSRHLDEPTMAWLDRYAEAPARYLADLVRGRVPAQSA